MPTRNRLKLDFSLENIEERIAFVNKYITNKIFIENPPTNIETETISNYILWGKDQKDGKNGVQQKEFEIETKSKLWSGGERVESLDALIESPTFDENTIMRPGEVRTKIPRVVFSRNEARDSIDKTLLPQLEELFRQIDETDLIINFYDLAHNKRKLPPREELLKRFSEKEQLELQEKASKLSQYHYLKLRHLLVELRQQQYQFKDSYSHLLMRDPSSSRSPYNPKDFEPIFETDIPVFPLGTKTPGFISEKLFQPLSTLIPSNFSEEELKEVSKFLWKHKEQVKRNTFFDFCELEHLYNALLMIDGLEESSERETVNYSTTNFLSTLRYYIEIAELSEVQREILDFKIRGASNQQIAAAINSKHGKAYTVNYISTIFRQKILPAIIEGVQYHLRVCENLFFPEEFKECNTCGRVLLRDSYNFVRKNRAKDGFTNRCKACDKADRQRKKT